MDILELQNNLIRKILDTKDQQILTYLYHLLSEEGKQEIYKLNQEEKDFINESLEEYRKGKTISNEDLNSKIEKWHL